MKRSTNECPYQNPIVQNVKCTWVLVVIYRVCFISRLVSPRAAEWRGGAVLCCTVQRLTSDWIPSPPSISLCPAWGWMRFPAVRPGEVSAECGRTGKTISNWSVLGRRWCLQLVTAEISQRVGESTDDCLLVRSWRGGRMDLRMISFSDWNSCFGCFSSLARNSILSQSRTSENSTD